MATLTHILLSAESAYAQATLTTDGDTGLFTVPAAYVLRPGETGRSLFRANWDRNPNDLDISRIGFTVARGFGHAVELFATAGHIRVKANDNHLAEGLSYTELPMALPDSGTWREGWDDLRVGGKIQLADEHSEDKDHSRSPISVALRIVLKFPTADENEGLGTGAVSLVTDFVVSKAFAPGSSIHAFLGTGKLGGAVSAEVRESFRWGVGVIVASSCRLRGEAEIAGRIHTQASKQQPKPVDVVFGPVLRLSRRAWARIAFAKNLNFDVPGRRHSFWSSADLYASIGMIWPSRSRDQPNCSGTVAVK